MLSLLYFLYHYLSKICWSVCPPLNFSCLFFFLSYAFTFLEPIICCLETGTHVFWFSTKTVANSACVHCSFPLAVSEQSEEMEIVRELSLISDFIFSKNNLPPRLLGCMIHWGGSSSSKVDEKRSGEINLL